MLSPKKTTRSPSRSAKASCAGAAQAAAKSRARVRNELFRWGMAISINPSAVKRSRPTRASAADQGVRPTSYVKRPRLGNILVFGGVEASGAGGEDDVAVRGVVIE